ncbi:MAG TPA: hypothetical protein VM261_12425 [Kofleriaceae bacterium]|nr:hypothetical protein [Kofleriaceae bacterium]
MITFVIAVVAVLGSPKEMLSRLEGHTARIVDGDLVIEDVAGEGQPLIGVVERRGRALWVVGDGFAVELRGPLARPRIAGPGYRVWVLGARRGDVLVARRIGVIGAPGAARGAALGAAPSAAPARD